jgi:hypothetical protein
LKTAITKLPTHPQPINKIAALHIAGGDRVGREELHWDQREAFDHAMADARIRLAAAEVEQRRKLADADKQYQKDRGVNKYTAQDQKRRVEKIRNHVETIKNTEKRAEAAGAVGGFSKSGLARALGLQHPGKLAR